MSRKQASPSAFPKTHFGFHEVAEWEKAPRVRGVFTSVARRYDLMNDLMSGGIHRRWKNEMVALLRPRADWQVIDVAGGTGDIALRILDRLGPRGQVVICDLTEEMLQVGRDRAIDSGRLERLQWVQGDAQQLPFPDRSFDAYSIAFGLRNVTRIDEALSEAYRVLKPGSRIFCLEFSQVVLPLLDRLYEAYSFRVLPLLGQVVARDRASYAYLVESIRRFPPQAELAERMAAAGFEKPRWRNLSGGIAAIHSAWRL